MRFAYDDLGQRRAGDTAVVHLRGTAANVILLDAANFACYRTGRPFRYAGGLSRRSPVELEIPRDGHWYVVLDLGGFPGRARGTVEVREGDADDHPVPRERVHVRA